MKIRPGKIEHGSVLLISLMVSGIIAFILVSYLNMAGNQNSATYRSQAWNSAIPVLEAGIEEALAHIHHNGPSSAADGWTLQNNVYSKTRTIGDDYYTLGISNVIPPVIYAQGFVNIPSTDQYVARMVRVETRRDGMFTKAIVAQSQIDINGKNVQTDSFDSSDPNFCTNGQYDPSKTKDNGGVATNSGLISSINIGNATIRGGVSTGPGGSVDIGPNGAIGSQAWHDGGNTGIQPGWSIDDMNVVFADVEPPFSGGYFTPVGGSVGGTSYTYILSNGNYQLNSMSMSGHEKTLVNGNAVLYVDGNVSLSGNAYIEIAPGASLHLYVGGSSTALGGNGVINETGLAANFMYYGLPSNTSVSMSGNAGFAGVIYAPAANFTLNGGGNNTYDFVGASVTGTATINGHFNFHYDEALGNIGPTRGYLVTSWNEL